MDRDARAYLWDVQQAAEAIDQFAAGLEAASYTRNALVRAAVEWQFEIIGESLREGHDSLVPLVSNIANTGPPLYIAHG